MKQFAVTCAFLIESDTEESATKRLIEHLKPTCDYFGIALIAYHGEETGQNNRNDA